MRRFTFQAAGGGTAEDRDAGCVNDGARGFHQTFDARLAGLVGAFRADRDPPVHARAGRRALGLARAAGHGSRGRTREGDTLLAYWLVKTEPGEFSWDDLIQARREPWDGVRNRAAQRHIAAMRPGDLALFYHTGNERQAVGVCRVVSDPYPEPGQDDPRIVVADVEPVRRLPAPVTLAAVKADPAFADWALVRQSRLSVMPVPEDLWRRVLAMAGEGGG